MLYAKTFLLSLFLALVLAGFAQININIYEIPLTGQTLAVGLIATIFSLRVSLFSVLIYLILGAVGLEVFAGFKGGYEALLGKTGGFLFGFIFYVIVAKMILEINKNSYVVAIFANIAGTFVTLVCGTLWLYNALDKDLLVVIGFGFTPYIIPGLIKSLLSAIVGIFLRGRVVNILDNRFL